MRIIPENARLIIKAILLFTLAVAGDRHLPDDIVTKSCFCIFLCFLSIALFRFEKPETDMKQSLFFNFKKPPDDKDDFTKNSVLEIR